jgi:cation transport regulator
MPYLSNADLPLSVRNNLPSHAQDIYRTAFNNAYENHAHNPIEEADAHNIAWAAVKRSYVKEGGEWVPRGVPG